MKIDFQTPDSYSQLEAIKSLLEKAHPTKEDIATAMLLAMRIFYENRPGKLEDLPGYSIHGTGCHNPTSEKTNKTIMGIWRTEITIERRDDEEQILTIKHELMQGGYLKAVFKNGSTEQVATADIVYDKKDESLSPTAISIGAVNADKLMADLNDFLKEPIDELLRVTEKESPPVEVK